MEDSIKFNCAGCGLKVKTQLVNAGKKGRCHNCKTLCNIPEEKIKYKFNLEKDLSELNKKWELQNEN